MLNVKTPEEVLEIIEGEFVRQPAAELVPLMEAPGRVLAEDVFSAEYVPDFDRSTVDGYALRAADSFGCSDSIPAVLNLLGAVSMGKGTDIAVTPGSCAAIPTGGQLPPGADSVVMKEYAENYGDGTIGVLKSVAPGAGLIFRGDDVYPGKQVLSRGRRLSPQDIGALAAMGKTEVSVTKKPLVGIVSTGDELVPCSATPGPGQVRDVNSVLLAALCSSFGAKVDCRGIVSDDDGMLLAALQTALDECDIVLISGGSSVGERDAACKAIESCGRLLLHGVAMKPGKPLIVGSAGGKPVFGLPGHPAAANFTAQIFVRAAIAALSWEKLCCYPVPAVLDENVGANHGRAEYVGVKLYRDGGVLCAKPVKSKSGLISSLAGTDGYFCIDRDCEGVAAGSEIQVIIN